MMAQQVIRLFEKRYRTVLYCTVLYCTVGCVAFGANQRGSRCADKAVRFVCSFFLSSLSSLSSPSRLPWKWAVALAECRVPVPDHNPDA